MANTGKFQTVSIWWIDDHFTVRGYRRGASHFIGRFDTLQDAVAKAFETPRKQLTVGLVPAKEEFDAFAEQVAKALGVSNG